MAAEESPRQQSQPPREGERSSATGASPSAGADSSTGSSRGGHRRKPQGSFLRELPVILIAALVLSLLIKTFLVQAFYIPSGSMENTLLVGDRVFVSKISTRFGDVHRGDVVVFKDPSTWLADQPKEPGPTGLRGAVRHVLEFVGVAPATTGDDLIKRVIGVGGDTVACCDAQGRVTVNGVPLDETYIYPGDAPSDDHFKQKVPNGELWVMGDHRSVSEDSRRHTGLPGGGFVPEKDVIGKAFVIVWPFNRFTFLHRSDTFARLNSS